MLRHVSEQNRTGNRTHPLMSYLRPLSRSVSKTKQEEEEKDECGPMCTLLLNLLQGSFNGITEHVDAARDRENEIDFDASDDGLDVNDSTHTTKVNEGNSAL